MNMNVHFILVQNDKNKNLIILQHTHLKTIAEYDEEDCYHSSMNDLEIAALCQVKSKNELRLLNSITVYEANAQIIRHLTAVTEAYSDIWHDTDKTVNILKTDFLQIPLRDQAVIKNDVKKLFKKVYPLGEAAQNVVNKAFDKLQTQGKMNWFIKPTSFDFSVFVVWKTVMNKNTDLSRQKRQSVIDICELNWLTQLNSYSLPL